MASIFSRYGTWLACCLSRGPSSPLGKTDLAMLAENMGTNSVAGGTFVFREGDQTRLIDLLTGGLEAQLASVLLRNADGAGEVKITQKDLGAMLGVQRSSVQRVLKELESAGLIDLGYRRVAITDAAGLASLVDTAT